MNTLLCTSRFQSLFLSCFNQPKPIGVSYASLILLEHLEFDLLNDQGGDGSNVVDDDALHV